MCDDLRDYSCDEQAVAEEYGGDGRKPVNTRPGAATVGVREAVGMVLAHDLTEIRPGEFKGAAFRKGHVVRAEDVEHLERLGKERLYILKPGADQEHEDDAARRLVSALCGPGVEPGGEPREGKIDLVAKEDGLLRIDRRRLEEFNMLGEVICSTLHDRTEVKKGGRVAATRAIPLLVERELVDKAVAIASEVGGICSVTPLRKPRAGVVITGGEVYSGRVKDAFAPVITEKIRERGGELVGLRYAPDDEGMIEAALRELLEAGADLLITTGGMSVDPDDVTRFAIRKLGATETHYGSPVLPGAMVLVGYVSWGENGTRREVPVIGVPACGMYHKITVVDMLLPRLLAGERIGRRELAGMGHGGLCLHCETCRYPVCPFGRD